MSPDIFSSFDPSNSLLFSMAPLLFWLTTLIVVLLAFSATAPLLHLMNNLSLNLNLVFLNQTKTTSMKLLFPSTLLIILYMILLPLNLLGMIPYMFSTTAHLLFSLSTGLPLWFTLIISGLSVSLIVSASNLLPTGAPMWLSPPLTIIESISILIRPMTLSIRLAANMSAGHIVLSLISDYNSSTLLFSKSYSLMLTSASASYIAFELTICLIQGYIFFLLLTLYANEHPSTNS